MNILSNTFYNYHWFKFNLLKNTKSKDKLIK